MSDIRTALAVDSPLAKQGLASAAATDMTIWPSGPVASYCKQVGTIILNEHALPLALSPGLDRIAFHDT